MSAHDEDSASSPSPDKSELPLPSANSPQPTDTPANSRPSTQPSSQPPIDREGTPMSGMRRIRSDSSRRVPANESDLTSQLSVNGSFQWSFSALNERAIHTAIDYGVSSEQGSRTTMEDQHMATCGHREKTPRASSSSESSRPNSARAHTFYNIPFFGVYDGHGGIHCADFLRDHLHEYIVAQKQTTHDPEQAIKDGIARAEREFLEKCKNEGIESGSTAAVAMILDNKLITGNVGDSEIVLSRNGKPILLTVKHTMAANPDELERVKNCGGRVYKSRVGHPKFNPSIVSLAVSRAIGDAGFKLEEFTDGKPSGVTADADTTSIELTPQDEFLVIGCDGLWDVMTYDDVVNYCRQRLSQGQSSQSITEELVQEALRRGSTDNVTVLFVALRKDVAEIMSPQSANSASMTEASQRLSTPLCVAKPRPEEGDNDEMPEQGDKDE